MPSPLARNLEIKVICPTLDEVQGRLSTLNTTIGERLRQIDTYFPASHGRLKLRTIAEIAPDGLVGDIIRAELIGY